MSEFGGWTIAAQTYDHLGESALWHPREQVLYWIDLFGSKIHRLDPATGSIVHWPVPDAQTVGSIVFATQDRLIVAAQHELRLLDLKQGTFSFFADPDACRPGMGYNDSKVDRSGRYWLGNYDIAEAEPRGILYRVHRDGRSAVGDAGFVVCNGPAFSPDNRILYFSDTLARRLLSYEVNTETGVLSRRRVFTAIPTDEGLPDGLTVDREGHVWCAHYGAGCVSRFAPDGNRVEKIGLPVPHVTSCALGGADLRTLYVTSGWSPSVTAAGQDGDIGGALFARRVEVPGLPETMFDPLPGEQS